MNWFKMSLTLLAVSSGISAGAQFAPAAGQPGSTAIYKDSSIIRAWATGCEVSRGLAQITEPDSGWATVGDAASALGKAGENGVVSLGDGGWAVLTFSTPIFNGPGPDFCVFENSFLDNYLELAFVEVSSDGMNFVRFPAISLTQDTVQTDGFGFTQPEAVNNLAGKYRALYGTPFDLEELKDSTGININNITHIKVQDVVGSIYETFASFDQEGNKINDPWPTPFPSSGFDLDAIGVIYPEASRAAQAAADQTAIFPNPFGDAFYCKGLPGSGAVLIYDLSGKMRYRETVSGHDAVITAGPLQSGTYIVEIIHENRVVSRKVMTKK